MTLDEIIKTTVGAVAGLSGKVYPHTAIKSADAPFVFYLQESGNEELDLTGTTGLMSADYQVHVAAKTHASMQLYGRSVTLVLQALQGSTQTNIFISSIRVSQTQPDVDERDVGLFRKPLTVHFEYQLVA